MEEFLLMVPSIQEDLEDKPVMVFETTKFDCNVDLGDRNCWDIDAASYYYFAIVGLTSALGRMVAKLTKVLIQIFDVVDVMVFA